ncbi:winged helix-turn-helix domain-containing protein, partial [Kribbella capetownensis]
LVKLRTLTGDDLAAAGTSYGSRVRGSNAAGTDDNTVEQAPETTSASSPSTPHTHQPAAAPTSETSAAPAPIQPAAKGNGINGVTNAVARFRQAQRETNAIAIISELRVAGAAGVSTAELVDRLGLPKATVNRHIRALIGEGQVARGGDGRARLLEDAA